MKNSARLIITWSFLLLFVFLTSVAAQTITATVTGTVMDASGAVIPGVQVVATNEGTNISYSALSNDAGVYTIPFLPVGTYVITGELSGFKKAVTNPIKLEVGQIARVDIKLELGEISQQVNVVGLAPILQTETTSVGDVITGSTTVSLPLNGRNFQQLTLLVPGVITPNVSSFTSPSRAFSGGRPYVNGNREQGNNFLLDGVDMNETIDNLIGYNPNVDAIGEFRIITNNSSSEFGNVTGAIVNTTLKSGTNEVHGDVFEFIRNDALDANSWGNNRSGAPKSSLRQNIFGFTVGGPVVKNKIFFFGDYQGTRLRTGGGTTASVAPDAWRHGDLSSLPQRIIDPLTNQQFPGNKIPENRIVNPVAKFLFANPNLYPLPNRSIASVVGNYVSSFANATDNNQWDTKIDAKMSDHDDIFGRFSYAAYNLKGTKAALPVFLPGLTDAPSRSTVLNWNHAFSPTTINEARFGFNRVVIINSINDWAGLGNGNAKFGIPGDQPIPGLSSVSLGDGLNSIGNSASLSNTYDNTFQYGDNLSFARGRHFLKTGFQWLRYQQNRYYAGNNGALGLFEYGTSVNFTGSAFADFLLDLLARKGRGSASGSWGHRQNRIGIFAQDDFKLKSNFTLNLGMRWEYTSPVVEVNDRQSNFDLATGKQLFAGKDGNSRALYEPFYNGFEPRLGFAWTPSGKFVVRAGYGIVQYMEGTGANLRLPLNPPFFFESDVTFNATSGPGSITKGFTDVLPQDKPSGQVRAWNPDLRPQFTQQWNLTLEYQLSNSMSLTTGYVGHKATHLVVPTEFNQPLPDAGPPSTWRPLQQRRRLYATAPLITNISGTDSSAISNYHALQVSARQRFSKGLEFLASYTLSKSLTDSIGYYGSGGVNRQGTYWANTYDRKSEFGPAFFDATHNFAWSGSYDLPVGRGRALGNDWNSIAESVLGGWNVSSIISLHSGFPVTVLTSDRSLQAVRGGQRPNRVGEGKVDNPTLTHWLDITAFQEAPLGTFGNEGVGILRAPGFANWDFGLGKKFKLHEQKYLDFRAEFFNFNNNPSFGPPNRDFNVPGLFGQVLNVVNSPRNVEFGLKFYF
ncbi:MAG TPA: TonB-dependent receptor [Acidobacteriota bacterium]